jgi:hypothetical protein
LIGHIVLLLLRTARFLIEYYSEFPLDCGRVKRNKNNNKKKINLGLVVVILICDVSAFC